jgi:hypothetical protein
VDIVARAMYTAGALLVRCFSFVTLILSTPLRNVCRGGSRTWRRLPSSAHHEKSLVTRHPSSHSDLVSCIARGLQQSAWPTSRQVRILATSSTQLTPHFGGCIRDVPARSRLPRGRVCESGSRGPQHQTHIRRSFCPSPEHSLSTRAWHPCSALFCSLLTLAEPASASART